MKKNNRNIYSTTIFTIVFIFSNYLIRSSSAAITNIFTTLTVFTYFGVLIGFSLTIYTFGFSMILDIKNKIDRLKNLSNQKKEELFLGLTNGFKHIRDNIWLIFYSILTVIIFGILKEVKNPFGWQIQEIKIPETINLTLFITTTVCMKDIIGTLFNLSEIAIELTKKNSTS